MDFESQLPDLPDLDEMGGEQDYVDYAEKAQNLMIFSDKLYHDATWTEEYNSDGCVTATTFEEGSSIKSGKRTMEVNADIEKVVEFFRDPENQKRCNPDFITAKKAEIISDNAWLNFFHIKGILVISERDDIVFEYNIKMKDGSYCKLMTSIEHPDYPENEGIVRSECVYNFFHFSTPSEGKTLIRNVAKYDLKGSIPAMVINHTFSLAHQEFINYKAKLEA